MNIFLNEPCILSVYRVWVHLPRRSTVSDFLFNLFHSIAVTGAWHHFHILSIFYSQCALKHELSRAETVTGRPVTLGIIIFWNWVSACIYAHRKFMPKRILSIIFNKPLFDHLDFLEPALFPHEMAICSLECAFNESSMSSFAFEFPLPRI